MITPMLSLEDVRPEARKAAEAWVLKADPQYKKRFYRFFADGPEGASPARASAGSAGGAMPSLTTFEEAEKELEKIEFKLQGIDQLRSPTPRSVEGQVQRLINDATDINNLCQMYLWWMPWT